VYRRHRSAKPVTEASLGLDQLRPRRIRFDLAPQAQYLHIDRSVVDLRAAQSRKLEQLITAENVLRMTKQCH
jgi:hypothetical protein